MTSEVLCAGGAKFLSLHTSLWRPINCKEFSFLPLIFDSLTFRTFYIFFIHLARIFAQIAVSVDVLLVYICTLYVYNGFMGLAVWP